MASDPNVCKLPPQSDMTTYYKAWMNYDVLHENKQQKPIEDLARAHSCILISRDLVADKMWREFKCTGFETGWKLVLRAISRQAAGYSYLSDVNNERSIPESVLDDIDGACFYEMVKDGYPCHPVFDIEYYLHKNPKDKFDEVIDAFLDAVDRTFEEYYGLIDMRKSWTEVWTDSTIEIGIEPKISRHLVIRLPYNLMFASWTDLGAFTRRVGVMCIRMYGHPDENKSFIVDPNETYKTVVFDASIYSKWRSMRMLGNSKKGKRRPFHLFTRTDADGRLVNIKHSFRDIVREKFLKTLIQAPPDDPSRVRSLYCTEPDGAPAESRGKMPFYAQGQYCFDMQAIGQGGSMASAWICKSASDAFSRVVSVGDAANVVKHKNINEHEAKVIRDSIDDYDPQISMAKFLIALGDKVAGTLGVSDDVLKTKRFSDAVKKSLRQPDKVAYYRNYSKSAVMTYQMTRLWCPFKKNLHKSNHIKYTVELAPDGNRTADPLIHAKCYSCSDTKGSHVRMRWWDTSWDERRAEYFRTLDESDKITTEELFGWFM